MRWPAGGRGDGLAELHVARRSRLAAGCGGQQVVERHLAGGQGIVDELGEQCDLVGFEEPRGERGVVAHGEHLDRRLVGAQAKEQAGDGGDLVGPVEAVRCMAATNVGAERLAHQPGDEVGLPGAEVGDLGTSPQLGVLDGVDDTPVGGEDEAHRLGVAVEDRGHHRHAGQIPGPVVGADLSAQPREPAQPNEGRAVARCRPATDAVERSVGLGAGLFAVLDVELDGALESEEVDRRGVAFVLQPAQEPVWSE